MENSTAWKSFSTEPPIQRSSRTGKSPNSSSDINSKSSQENHLNKATRNATSNHPYPGQAKHRNPRSQSRPRMINALPRPGSRQSPMKLGSRKDNAYAVGHLNIKHSGAQTIHTPTSPKTLLLQETDKKSHASAPSIVNNQKTWLPLSVSSSAGAAGRAGVWIGVIGYEGVDGNIRGNSTASDCTKAEGCLSESESAHV